MLGFSSATRALVVLMLFQSSSVVLAGVYESKCPPQNHTLANDTTYGVLCPVPSHLRMLYCYDREVFIHTSFVATTTTSTTTGSCNSSYSLVLAEVAFGLDRNRGVVPNGILHRQLPRMVSDLNGFFCDDSRRQGKLCSKCRDGCGIALYNYYGLPCACPCHSYGIPLYFLLEIGFSLLFLFFVFLFKFSVFSGRWYGLVLFFQTTTNIGKTYPIMFTLYSQQGHKLHVLFDTVFGVWNMDFFRLLMPRFCVSRNAGTLAAICTGYFSALWPLLMVLTISLIVKLHRCNCRVLVRPWELLNRVTRGVIRRRIAETNLIETFATFLFLSYVKLMYVSFALLGATVPYEAAPGATAARQSHWVSLDTDVPFGSRKHLRYAIPAVVLVLFVGILLPLVLLIYPCKCTHRLCGGRNGRHWLALKMFIEVFHGGFKDGTDGTRDYRMLPAIFLLIKVFLGFTFALRGIPLLAYNLPLIYLALSLFALLMAALFGLAKPYKEKRHNLIDVLLYTLVAVQCATIFTLFSDWKYARSLVSLLLLISSLPGLAVYCVVAFKIFKHLCLNIQ